MPTCSFCYNSITSMNQYQLANALGGYPVSICPADALRVSKGTFVISNTDKNKGPGKHLVVFYFPKRGRYKFLDSLGRRPEEYGVDFEKIFNKKYIMNDKQLQHNTSNLCGLYCIYYIMKRSRGNSLKKIVSEFNPRRKKQNDHLLLAKLNANPTIYDTIGFGEVENLMTSQRCTSRAVTRVSIEIDPSTPIFSESSLRRKFNDI